MEHPQYLYYAAILLMAAVELALRMRGREAFGRAIWVLLAIFLVSLAACNLGASMPPLQLGLHSAGFVIGLALSRNLPGHITAAIFLPMATVDLFQIIGMVSIYAWWWAIYYLALAQLVPLAVGADLHPVGRWIRAWAQRVSDKLEFRALALRGYGWTI